MSVNTIKLNSQEGDLYIAPQSTITYKGYTLFGYGYLDWGRVANQALVDLIDKIDLLQDGGVSELQFDLETYKEEQDVLRTEEFNIWKTEFRSIMETTVNSFVETMNTNYEEFIQTQTLMNEQVNQQLIDIEQSFKDEFDTFTAGINQQVLDIINANLQSLVSNISSLSTDLANALIKLNDANTNLENKVIEFKQIIENLKTTFETTFNDYKDEVAATLIQNKDNIIQYINDKLFGHAQLIESHDSRISSLEILIEGVSLEEMQTQIAEKVAEITEAAVNNYLGDLETRLMVIETTLSELDSYVTNQINEVITPLMEANADAISVIDNKVIAVEETFTDFNDDLNLLKNWQNTFDNLVRDYFIDHEDMIISTINTIFSEQNFIGLNYGNYKINKQNEYNNIIQHAENYENLNKIIDRTRDNFIYGLKSTSFNENALIYDPKLSNDSYINRLKYFENKELLINSNELKINNLNIIENGEGKIIYLFFNFQFPKNIFNGDFTHCILNITLGNDQFNFSKPIWKIPNNVSEVTEYQNYFQNFDTISNDITIGKIEGDLYFDNLNSTEMIKIGLNENEIYNISDDITINITSADATDSHQLVIRPTEFPNKLSDNYLFKIIENFNDFPQEIQDKLNLNYTQNDFEYIVDSQINNDNKIFDIPHLKITDNHLHIKIIGYNIEFLEMVWYDDTLDTTTQYGDIFEIKPKFIFNRDEYISLGYHTTLNYFTDIGSTGIVKLPIDQSATKVWGTINYRINGIDYSHEFTTENQGGGSSTNLDLGNFNLEVEPTNDDLLITHNEETKFTFANNGDFTASGNIYGFSDKELKENIEKLTNEDLNKILKIQPYIFNFKYSENKEFGVIAQEILELFPNLVIEDKESGLLKVNYIGLISLVLFATQELAKRLDSIEARLMRLEELVIKG